MNLTPTPLLLSAIEKSPLCTQAFTIAKKFYQTYISSRRGNDKSHISRNTFTKLMHLNLTLQNKKLVSSTALPLFSSAVITVLRLGPLIKVKKYSHRMNLHIRSWILLAFSLARPHFHFLKHNIRMIQDYLMIADKTGSSGALRNTSVCSSGRFLHLSALLFQVFLLQKFQRQLCNRGGSHNLRRN